MLKYTLVHAKKAICLMVCSTLFHSIRAQTLHIYELKDSQVVNKIRSIIYPAIPMNKYAMDSAAQKGGQRNMPFPLANSSMPRMVYEQPQKRGKTISNR